MQRTGKTRRGVAGLRIATAATLLFDLIWRGLLAGCKVQVTLVSVLRQRRSALYPCLRFVAAVCLATGWLGPGGTGPRIESIPASLATTSMVVTYSTRIAWYESRGRMLALAETVWAGSHKLRSAEAPRHRR
jgi:hypothetical protein